MNYLKTYNDIITKAKEEDKYGKRSIGYFEKHHIKPRSLGGNNDKENLIKLTAREHFICHWLLVKMYNKGTEERNKMLCAFWRMKGNPTITNCRYINSRAYEKLRIEFSQIISDKMSIMQSGKKNSQYGTKWYTNKITGESKKFVSIPSNEWIIGRNYFNNQKVYSIITHKPISIKTYNDTLYNTLSWTRNTWDSFHSSNCKSIKEFYEKGLCEFSWVTITKRFIKFIPLYTKLSGQGKYFSSNIDLVGRYS